MIGIKLGFQDGTAAIRPESSTVYNPIQSAANLMGKTCGKAAALAQVVLGVSLFLCAMLFGVLSKLAMAEGREWGRLLAFSRELSVGTQFCVGARNHFPPIDHAEDE